ATTRSFTGPTPPAIRHAALASLTGVTSHSLHSTQNLATNATNAMKVCNMLRHNELRHSPRAPRSGSLTIHANEAARIAAAGGHDLLMLSTIAPDSRNLEV